MKSILLVKKLLGLVEMTSGLVNANFSSPEWQAVKMIFFAPCALAQFFGLHPWPNGRWLTDQSEHVLYFCYVIKVFCVQKGNFK